MIAGAPHGPCRALHANAAQFSKRLPKSVRRPRRTSESAPEGQHPALWGLGAAPRSGPEGAVPQDRAGPLPATDFPPLKPVSPWALDGNRGGIEPT